jgi:hypothetical protein
MGDDADVPLGFVMARKEQRTVLDQILSKVKYGKSEVTLDVEGYTSKQISRIKTAAKSRNLNVSGCSLET